MHTFVLTMILIGAGESISTANFSTIQQCESAGRMFQQVVPSNMGHRTYWTCQQADSEPMEQPKETY